MPSSAVPPPPEVVRCGDFDGAALSALLRRYDLSLDWLAPGAVIDGSYWGDSEAGLIDSRLLVRADTPLHSALHETCHYVCMPASRRRNLHTNAGGDYDEENAVCYLQILLADKLPGFGRGRMYADMDAWGYGFRLGSARAWFETDAEDARTWLLRHGLISGAGAVTWRRRR